ncbi:MAG: glycine--tRNA ligase subunit beta, partial [Alphaproteobacteria bacterium]|nr:glycine--tRNA ligase subunit beta [Alphaproteobacteria bacterium]
MRQELLLEFFSEEIPARFQKKAISDSKEVFTRILADYGAEFSDIETYVSPRRIAIRVSQLADKTKDTSEERRGPRVSAPKGAIEGFLNANRKKATD